MDVKQKTTIDAFHYLRICKNCKRLSFVFVIPKSQNGFLFWFKLNTSWSFGFLITIPKEFTWTLLWAWNLDTADIRSVNRNAVATLTFSGNFLKAKWSKYSNCKSKLVNHLNIVNSEIFVTQAQKQRCDQVLVGSKHHLPILVHPLCLWIRGMSVKMKKKMKIRYFHCRIIF